MAKFRRSHNPKASKVFSGTLLWVLLLTLLILGGVGMYFHLQKSNSALKSDTKDFRALLPFFPRGEVYTHPEFSLNYDALSQTVIWFSFPSRAWQPPQQVTPKSEPLQDILISPRPERQPELKPLLKGCLAIDNQSVRDLTTDSYLYYWLTDTMIANYQQQISLIMERFGGKSDQELIVSGPFIDEAGFNAQDFFVAILQFDPEHKIDCRFFLLDLQNPFPAEGISIINAGDITDRGGPDFKACRS